MNINKPLLDSDTLACRLPSGPTVSSLTLLSLFISLALFPRVSVAENSNTFEFDESMLMGSATEKKNIARFSQANRVEPGNYQVDIFVNGDFFSRASLVFKADEQNQVSACFSREMLLEMGILADSIKQKSNQDDACLNLEQSVDGSSSRFDFARLRLDVHVPQAMMQRTARGAVATSDLAAGETVAFANYDTNYYRTHTSGIASESMYLGVTSGFNLGLLQFRQQSALTRFNSGASSGSTQWNSIRNYVQRPLPAIGSQLTAGDSFTSGSLFSSLGFRGVQVETDDRMLPESRRGYAPTIRGIAATTAKVSVSQSGVQIYQTTVAPGAFVIDDLYPTSYQGDLDVEVQEADGRTSSFTVPFAAVSDSMRPGQSRISFAAGEVRNIGKSDALFADLTYQAGLSNAITGNTGVRISDRYQAVLGGAVLASRFGAIGVNTTYSQAAIGNETVNGWRVGTTYSRTFVPTATTLALAGYRYSTQGYRDLSDVLGQRETLGNDSVWVSNTYQQSNQFVATVSQGLGKYGQLGFSGSTSTYRGGRGRDTQYQLAYSQSHNGISYNLSMGRQQTGRSPSGLVGASDTRHGNTQNVVMFSVSMPWGSSPRSPMISAGMTRQTGSNNSHNYQTSLTGSLGEDHSLSYALNGAFDSGGEGASVGANLTTQLPVMTVGGSLSQGKHYTQGGASARGAVVAHSGGLTFGPYLGDTFALIEAEGVKGAEVINGMGARINSSGYAIVPSLMPYRYNEIGLDAKGIENAGAELSENQQRVAPYAGSAVKVRFRTLEGYALLIKLRDMPEGGLPLGSNIYDRNDTVVGLVGQENHIYARAPDKKGMLRVKWGEGNAEQCVIHYDLQDKDMKQSLYRLEASCLRN